jgi:hypothetical protein
MNDEFEHQLELLMKMIEPLPTAIIQYRLYYDKFSGDPLFFSMESLPGDYIIVSKEDYEHAAINYIQVIDGKLTKKKLSSQIVNRLSIDENKNSNIRTLLNDIQFVVDESYTGPVSVWKLND